MQREKYIVQQTPIAEAIDTTDDKAKLDIYGKHLLSHKEFLSIILKDCLEEFKDYTVDEIRNNCFKPDLKFMSKAMTPNAKDREDSDYYSKLIQNRNEDNVIGEKTIFYDIFFDTVFETPNTNTEGTLGIDVELQNEVKKATLGYPLLKRAVYYSARMLSAQLNPSSNKESYDDLHKAVSIWICPTVTEKMQNTITKFRLTSNKFYGNYDAEKADFDLLEVILIGLKPKQAPKGEEVSDNDTLLLLNELFSNDDVETKKKCLEDNLNLKMTQAIEKEMSNMYTLADFYEEKGIEKGIEKCKFEMAIQFIANLIKNKAFTFKEAFNTLGLPEGEYPFYKDLYESLYSSEERDQNSEENSNTDIKSNTVIDFLNFEESSNGTHTNYFDSNKGDD